MTSTKELIKNILFVISILVISSIIFQIIREHIGQWRYEKEKANMTTTASSNVQMLENIVTIDYLNATRTLSIYLPPNYDNGTTHYPVIYFYDGQSLFDRKEQGGTEWKIDEVLDSLYQTDRLSAIVVGVYNSNIRSSEYKPFPSPHLRREKIVSGDKHAEWIATDLKNWIDDNYRTKTDARHTFIGGASLGGLMAWYSIATYPEIYGGGFIYSPSLWVDEKVFDLGNEGSIFSSKLIYVNAGELETPIVKDAEKLSALLKDRGMTTKNLLFNVIPKEGHWHSTWRKGSRQAIPWVLKMLMKKPDPKKALTQPG